MSEQHCELCAERGGHLVHDDGRLRVVAVEEPDYPGFIRVIWNSHVRELTDLAPADREHLMRVVFGVERVQRDVLRPHKMNVACLGNVTPHLHWHLIPRHADDAHFPAPIWAERRRVTPEAVLAARRAQVPGLIEALAQALRGC
ncbi:MAG TPA: HIT family protein [Burkholderiaceae bacterium]|nr:HIT family protein [Burkholderiaceae bacterium]